MNGQDRTFEKKQRSMCVWVWLCALTVLLVYGWWLRCLWWLHSDAAPGALFPKEHTCRSFTTRTHLRTEMLVFRRLSTNTVNTIRWMYKCGIWQMWKPIQCLRCQLFKSVSGLSTIFLTVNDWRVQSWVSTLKKKNPMQSFKNPDHQTLFLSKH